MSKIKITKVFEDLDGCLADWDKLAIDIFGSHPEYDLHLPSKDMWRTIAKYSKNGQGFFDSLEWISGSKEFWKILKKKTYPAVPTILSGVAIGDWCIKQKTIWINRELGINIPRILCFARDKQNYSGPGKLLIDDKQKNLDQWAAMGGETILFKSPVQAIRDLEKYDFSECYLEK